VIGCASKDQVLVGFLGVWIRSRDRVCAWGGMLRTYGSFLLGGIQISKPSKGEIWLGSGCCAEQMRSEFFVREKSGGVVDKLGARGLTGRVGGTKFVNSGWMSKVFVFAPQRELAG
jgi:hypothetical protein